MTPSDFRAKTSHPEVALAHLPVRPAAAQRPPRPRAGVPAAGPSPGPPTPEGTWVAPAPASELPAPVPSGGRARRQRFPLSPSLPQIQEKVNTVTAWHYLIEPPATPFNVSLR